MSIYPTAASRQLQVAGTEDPVHLCCGMQLSLMGDLEEEVEIYTAWGVIQGLRRNTTVPELIRWPPLLHTNGDRVAPSGIACKCQQDGTSYPFCFCAWNVFATDEECWAVLGMVTVNAVLLENHQFRTMTLTGQAHEVQLHHRLIQGSRSSTSHQPVRGRSQLRQVHQMAAPYPPSSCRPRRSSSPAWISRSIDDVFDIGMNHNHFPHRLLAPFNSDVGTSDDQRGNNPRDHSVLSSVFRSWDSPQGASGAVFLYALGRNIVCPHCNWNPAGLYNYDQHTCHNGGQGLQLPENIEEVGNTADGNGDDDSEGHREE
ncbi:hypothetical protein JB92DRAFT_3111764 [Gautieria morchelliformis]|nr:hypothetical protein JB92DRAFT_3111764 [Gautieria morchelliformis]